MKTIQKWLLTVLLIVVVAGLIITFQRYHHLEPTALFYIGLPAILSFVLIKSNKGRSPMATSMKGITLALLLSAPLLQEGFICIVMAAPIFYVVGAVVVWIYVSWKKRADRKLHSYAPLLLLVVAAMEGSHDKLSFSRDNRVTVEKIVVASEQQVAASLQQPVRYGRNAPLFLKMFPFPEVIEHGGTQIGDKQTLQFVYNKHFVTNVHRGDIVFEVYERSDRHIATRVISDTSYLHTYMDWQTSVVRWQPVDEQHTKVSWEIRYQRKLDPAWYFAPLEAWVTKMAAATLIDSAATTNSE